MSPSSSSLSSDDSADNMIIIRSPKVYKPRTVNFDKWTDHEFFQRFRLSKDVVLHTLEHIGPRIASRTNRGGAVRPTTKLLLTLRFYATGNMIISVAEFVGVSVATGSRIITEVSNAIASLKPNCISMPNSQRELERIAEDFYEIAHFPKCFGAIDCTHVRIISPGGEDAEIFRNRKGYYSINVQTIADAKLKIRNIVARWPGSCHDQTIFNNSSVKRACENGHFSNFSLIGDSGYALQKYLLTPLCVTDSEAKRLYNEALVRTRNVVERQYGVWKRRFPILSLGIRVNVDTAMVIIVATAVLHNIAIDMNNLINDELDFEAEDQDGNLNHPEENDFNGQEYRTMFINEYFNL